MNGYTLGRCAQRHSTIVELECVRCDAPPDCRAFIVEQYNAATSYGEPS